VVARRANVDTFPQISFAATDDSLSQTEDYFYFARTVTSDTEQGVAVARLLEHLGLAPYAALVYQDVDYSAKLKNHFVRAWAESGHTLLLEANLGGGGSAEDVVAAIAACPAACPPEMMP
jgi:ABC-type branched-subunit amino acid transport system substrate-binding protein